MVRAQNKKYWTDANNECMSQGASLISIHNDNVQDQIHNVIKNRGVDVWIGLKTNSNY